MPLAHAARGRQIGQQLRAFVPAESAKAAPQERWLGSRAVIASVCGKLKRLAPHQAASGFTGLRLTVGARVSGTTPDVIHKALETVPTTKVRQWCQQRRGPSVQAQRQQAFRSLKQAEEKRLQFQQAA